MNAVTRKQLPPAVSAHVYRMAVALLVIQKFRDSLEKNGNVYHGGLIPNITSIQDVLTVPFEYVLAAVENTPEIEPSPMLLENVKRLVTADGG